MKVYVLVVTHPQVDGPVFVTAKATEAAAEQAWQAECEEQGIDIDDSDYEMHWSENEI